uniref:Uncharacterized protein n=1 Tax=Anguilla anguilla TaxID=7936 RepID=A0A0E9U0D2_ANGAN
MQMYSTIIREKNNHSVIHYPIHSVVLRT